MTSPTSDIPEALNALPIARIEELEADTGQGFGEILAEFTSGKWSISTMRAIVGLLDPDRPLETMGDLMAAGNELLGKASGGVLSELPGAALAYGDARPWRCAT